MSEAPVGSTEDPSRRKAALLLAGLGWAHALLFVLSYVLLSSTPGIAASDQELAAFYASGEQRRFVLTGLYVMPFAGITFLWFSAAMRMRVRAHAQARDELLSSVQHVSAILYVALFFVAAAADAIPAVGLELSKAPFDPAFAHQFPQFGATLMLAFAMRMAAMFTFTTSRLGSSTGLLPRWFTRVGLLAGIVLLLSPSFSRVLVLVFPLWLTVACALLVRSGSRPVRAG